MLFASQTRINADLHRYFFQVPVKYVTLEREIRKFSSYKSLAGSKFTSNSALSDQSSGMTIKNYFLRRKTCYSPNKARNTAFNPVRLSSSCSLKQNDAHGANRKLCSPTGLNDVLRKTLLEAAKRKRKILHSNFQRERFRRNLDIVSVIDVSNFSFVVLLKFLPFSCRSCCMFYIYLFFYQPFHPFFRAFIHSFVRSSVYSFVCFLRFIYQFI